MGKLYHPAFKMGKLYHPALKNLLRLCALMQGISYKEYKRHGKRERNLINAHKWHRHYLQAGPWAKMLREVM